MKPLSINLVARKNVWAKAILALVVLFALTTLGITLANTYDYYANTNVIESYESRIKKIKQREQRKRTATVQDTAQKKEQEKIRQDLDFLMAMVKKNMFPLTSVLTEIERIKPDKVDIDELNFSDDLTKIRIRGTSDHVGSISGFIIVMEESALFDVELSREEIDENKKILFELNAGWIADGYR